MRIPKTPIEFLGRYYHPDLDRPELSFNKLGEQWQTDIFIAPYFEPRIERIYAEAPRDWDKTGLIAACAFAQCFYKAGIIVRVYAADSDQAAIVRDSIERRILNHHPELKHDVELQARVIKFANGSRLIIEAADADSAFGKQQDVAIVDELHVWKSPNHQRLYESIVSKGRTKVVILTNAGTSKSGLCWDVREALRVEYEADPQGWVFWFSAEADPYLPSWLTPERLERRRRELPPGVFKRLHLCQWGAGGDLFLPEHVETCKRPGLHYVSEDDGGGVLALDFGRVKDWTAGAVVKNVGGSIRVLHTQTWRGSHKKPVQTSVALEYAERGFQDFGVSKAIIESWQMASVCERLTARYGNARVIEFKPSQQSVAAMSKTFYDLVTGGALNFPPDPALERELLELEAEESGADKSQFKIVYRRRAGGLGHGDRTRAVMMAAYFADQQRPSRPMAEILAGIASGEPRISFDDGSSFIGGGKPDIW